MAGLDIISGSMSQMTAQPSPVVRVIILVFLNYPFYLTVISPPTTGTCFFYHNDIIEEFPGETYQEWVAWYRQKKPDAIVAASRRISQMVKALQQAITLIDEKMIRTWVTDLVMTKTFAGMRFQESIPKRLSERPNKP